MATDLCYKQLFISFRNTYNRNMIRLPHLQSLLHFFSTQSESPTPQNSYISDYLVNSCGFSTDKALSISSHLTHLTLRPRKPESVLNFLRENGFNDTQIKNLICRRPKLLSTQVDKSLLPKFQILEKLGISGTNLINLVITNPGLLFRSANKQILPCIDFLRTFLTTDDMVIKAIRISPWLFNCDIKKHMTPNIQFLRKSGASDETIAKFCIRGHRLLLQPMDRFKDITERVEKLGFTRNSKMFVYAAHAMGSMSESKLEVKFEILRSLGWSEADIQSAFRRHPNYLGFTEGKIRRVMDFLLNTVGCERSYIVSHPEVLMFSLEKRVIPRYNVMQTLKSKGSIDGTPPLHRILRMNEEKFLNDYVFRYLENVPDLHEVYTDGKKSLIRQ